MFSKTGLVNKKTFFVQDWIWGKTSEKKSSLRIFTFPELMKKNTAKKFLRGDSEFRIQKHFDILNFRSILNIYACTNCIYSLLHIIFNFFTWYEFMHWGYFLITEVVQSFYQLDRDLFWSLNFSLSFCHIYYAQMSFVWLV